KSTVNEAQRAAAAVLAHSSDMSQHSEIALVAGAPDLKSAARVFGIPTNQVKVDGLLGNLIAPVFNPMRQVYEYYNLYNQQGYRNIGVLSKIASAIHDVRLASNLTPVHRVLFTMQVIASNFSTPQQALAAQRNLSVWAQENPQAITTVLMDASIDQVALAA